MNRQASECKTHGRGWCGVGSESGEGYRNYAEILGPEIQNVMMLLTDSMVRYDMIQLPTCMCRMDYKGSQAWRVRII